MNSIRFKTLSILAATLLTCFGLHWAISVQAADKSGRQKVIDFEDEVVEGVNKRPLDSLSQISEAEKRRKKPHLYRKRVGFRAETSEAVRELRYAQ